jgi:hypothetical protein
VGGSWTQTSEEATYKQICSCYRLSEFERAVELKEPPSGLRWLASSP